MARLPDSSALGERPMPVPASRSPAVAQYNPRTGFEDVPAQALEHSGAEMEHAASIVFQMKEQQDNLRAEDAFNQLRQKQIDLASGPDGFMNIKGANAVNQPILKTYGEKFDQSANALAGTLDNDYQKQLFARRSAVAGLELRQGLVRHIATESDHYAQASTDATISTEIRAASADPSTTQMSLARIDNSLDWYASRFGMPADWTKDKKAAARSDLYTSQVRTLLSTNPMLAKEYFNKSEVWNSISAKERPILEHMVKQATLPIEVKTEAENIMQTTKPSAVVGDLQALKRAIRTAEGSGAEAISSQGARGTMQITKGTFDTYAKPGESYDVEADRVAAAERKIEADYEFYGGDVRKTAAAYIGGRGAVDAQGNIVDYGKSGQLISDALGTTRSAYANKVAQLVGAIPQSSRDTRAMLGSWVAEAERRYPTDPVKRDALIHQIRGNVSTIVATQEGLQRDAQGVLIQATLGGPEGKNTKPVTKDQLFATPGAREAYLLLDPAAAAGIDARLQHNAIELERGHPMPADPKVTEDLYNRIFLPWGDSRKIWSETQMTQYFAHGMNMQSRNFLVGALNGQKDENGQKLGALRNSVLNSFRPQIVKEAIGQLPDPKSVEMFQNFREAALRKEVELQNKGINPATLYNTDSPDYVGKMVPQYQLTAAQRMQDMMQRIQVGTIRPAPAQPQYPTATNPKTGEKMILKDGKWQKQ